MKRYISAVILIAAIFTVVPGISHAQQEQTPTNERGQERSQAALTDARANRIRQRCSNIQDRLSQVHGRITTLKDSRGNLHDNIRQRLSDFVPRLEAAGLDTTTLEENISQLETKVEASNNAWDTYQTTLENLVSARCSADADIESFHEALEATKLARTNVLESVKEVRQFYTETLKTTIADIRDQLNQPPGEDNSEDQTEAEEEEE